MKRLLIIVGLLLTLCNVVGMGVAYACKCYEGGVLACEGNKECYHDANGKCHCTDYEVILE